MVGLACLSVVVYLGISNYMRVQEIRNLTNELTQGMEDIGEQMKPRSEYYQNMKDLLAEGKITHEQFCSRAGAGLTHWTMQKAIEEHLCQLKE